MSEAFRIKGTFEALETNLDSLWNLGCEGVWQDNDEVVAYFSERLDLPLEGSWERVDDDAYVERYYADLKPVYLEKLVIAPTHTEVSLKAGQKPLWLDPGMAFGTGHHETTKLALQALESVELFKKDVLDVGAGSGILAIAADLLGAARAYGVDNDPETLGVAEENRVLNSSRATFVIGTVQDTPSDSADVVAANLFAELHVQLASEYYRVLRKGGWLFVTGIMNEKLEAVLAALAPQFEIDRVVQEGEWSLVGAKPL